MAMFGAKFLDRIDVFDWRVYILVATQFRSCDDSFGLQLFCLYILPWDQLCMTNYTMVTSQMNHHMIWIGWQQGCKHVSRIRLKPSRKPTKNSVTPKTFFEDRTWKSSAEVWSGRTISGRHIVPSPCELKRASPLIRPEYTTLEIFLNTAVFLRLSLPFTLIRHENRPFENALPIGGI